MTQFRHLLLKTLLVIWIGVIIMLCSMMTSGLAYTEYPIQEPYVVTPTSAPPDCFDDPDNCDYPYIDEDSITPTEDVQPPVQDDDNDKPKRTPTPYPDPYPEPEIAELGRKEVTEPTSVFSILRVWWDGVRSLIY